MVAKLRTHKDSPSRADEALRDAVAFGLPHEARGTLDTEERDPVENRRPSSSTRRDAAAAHGPRRRRCPQAFADALADRLQGEAGPALAATDALGRAGQRPRRLAPRRRSPWPSCPYPTFFSGDGPAVREPVRVTRALRGLEVVLPHQPPHPLLEVRRPSQLRPH